MGRKDSYAEYRDQVLELVNQGRNNAEIGRALGIDRNTAAKYRDRLAKEGAGQVFDNPLRNVGTSQQVSASSALPDRILDILRSGPLGWVALTEAVKATRGAVCDACDALVQSGQIVQEGDEYSIPEPKAHEIDLEQRREKKAAKQVQQKYDSLLIDYDDLKKQLEAALDIRQVNPVQIERTERTQSEAAVIAVASDWHFGAIVRPETVNGLNEVNPEITQARAEAFFDNLLILTNKERAAVKIHNLVLCLLGDFIENYIHPELVEEATISPTEQTVMAQDALAGGIQYLLDKGDFVRILIPTAIGNHGRTTDKMRASTGHKNSFEQLMYWNLAKHFAGNDRVQFQIGSSYSNYFTVFGRTGRVHHGDAIKYQGGVGGLEIPLRRWIFKANQQIHADFTIGGHFHSTLINDDFMQNGSLVGASAYSMRFGFRPEAPTQIFRLLDAERGLTGYFPIQV